MPHPRPDVDRRICPPPDRPRKQGKRGSLSPTSPGGIAVSASRCGTGFFALGVAILCACCCCGCREQGSSIEREGTGKGLSEFTKWLRAECRDGGGFDKPGPLPRSDGAIEPLEAWISRKRDLYRQEGEEQLFWDQFGNYIIKVVRKLPSGQIRIRDLWGRPIRYECPARDPRFVYRLYSVGANGIDEAGKEDDVDLSFSYEHVDKGFSVFDSREEARRALIGRPE